MKKLFFVFVVLLGSIIYTNAETIVRSTIVDNSAVAPDMVNYWGYLEGKLGGDNSAMLFLDAKRRGWYSTNGYERNVRLSSYNQSTGCLILKAYDKKGKYVGQFVGTCSGDYVRYRGTFTNTKGGKVQFDLYQTFVGD